MPVPDHQIRRAALEEVKSLGSLPSPRTKSCSLYDRKECDNSAETTSKAEPAAQRSSSLLYLARCSLVLPRAAGRLRYRGRRFGEAASLRGVSAAPSSVSGAQEAL